jgi:hypothetical protein
MAAIAMALLVNGCDSTSGQWLRQRFWSMAAIALLVNGRYAAYAAYGAYSAYAAYADMLHMLHMLHMVLMLITVYTNA